MRRRQRRRLNPTPEQYAKSLHDSVAATLRMFREDDQKKTKLATVKKDASTGAISLSHQD
jgi:hypothetical protein